MGVHESVTQTPIGKKWSYSNSFHYDLSPTEKLLKYTNFVLGFAIVLFGISLAVVSLYIDEESKSFLLFIGESNLNGLKIAMGAGGVLIVLGALALLTTIRLNRKLMLFYISMTFISIIVEGAGVGIAINQIDQVNQHANGSFYDMIEHYADYNFEGNSTVPLDYMQKTVKCCGLYTGWADWNKTSGLATEWIKLHTDDVPDSCCVEGKQTTRCGFNQAKPVLPPFRVVYNEGCIVKFKSWVSGKASSIGIIGGATFFCQLTSAVFLFLLRQSMQNITF